MVGFVTIRDRDAWATIRGFAYQIDQTIQSWLDLESPNILELERGEDIDVVSKAVFSNQEKSKRQLRQVKYLNRNFSLRTPQTLAMLASFYEHRTNNPEVELNLAFITNSEPAIERPSPMSSSKSAIVLWSELRSGTLTTDTSDEVIRGVRTLLSSGGKPRALTVKTWEPFAQFVRNSTSEELLSFMLRVEWRTRNSSADLIHVALQERLSARFKRQIHEAENLYYRLFFYLTRLLSRQGAKRLTVEELDTQARTSVFSEADVAGANAVRDLLLELESRVASLEQGHALHEARLALIDAQLKGFGDFAGSVGVEYSSPRVQLDPPPIMDLVVPRSTVINRILEQLQITTWYALHGNIGCGKTQLALLVAQNLARPTAWVRFRGLSPNQACVRIDETLTALSDIRPGASWGSWCREVFSKIAIETLVVLDDLPRVRIGDLLFDRVLELLKQSASTNVRFFSTSPFSLPNQLKKVPEGSLFIEETPRFSDEEIRELFQIHGAPDEFCSANRIGLIQGLTRGHPTLLTAMAIYLAGRHWTLRSEEFDALIRGEYAAEANEQTRIALMKSVPDFEGRELLYRLNLVGTGSFTNEDVQCVSEVSPPVLHPMEKMTQTIGLWVQREAGNSYILSPLLQQLGSENLQQVTAKAIHLRLASSIFRKGHLGPQDVFQTINHYLSADEHNQAARTLIWALSAMSNQDVDSDPWGISTYWLEVPLPAQIDLSLKIHLRAMQAVVGAQLKRPIEFVLNDLDELLESGEASEATAIAHATIVAGPLFYEAGFSRATRYLIRALRLAPDDVLPDGTRLAYPAGSSTATLIWATVRMLQTRDDVSHWFDVVEQFTPSQLDSALGAPIAADSAMALADRLWLWEARKPAPERNWKKVLHMLETLTLRAKALGAEILWACLVRSQIIVLAEYLTDLDAATLVGQQALAIASRDPAVQFILKMSVGTQFIDAHRFDVGVQLLREAVDEPTDIYPLFHYASLLKLAVGVGQTDAGAAVALSTKAVDVVRASPDLPESELIKALGENAISLWLSGHPEAAYLPLEEGAERLLGTKPTDDDGKSLLSLFGHVSGFLTHLVSTGTEIQRTAEDSDYTRPERGMFLRNYPLIAANFRKDLVRFLPAQIAYFARAIGNDDGLAKWGLRAMEEARLAGDVTALVQIAPLALDVELTGRRAPESIDAALHLGMGLIAFHLDVTAGRNPLRIDVNIPELLGQKPNSNWLAAERQAVTLGIVPWFFQLGLQRLNGESNLSEPLDQLRAACGQVSSTAADPQLWDKAAALMSDIFNGVSSSELMQQAKSFTSESSDGLQALAFLGASMDSFPEQALHNHLETLPLVIDSLRGMRTTFAKVVIPFYKLFWQRALREHRFRFRTPRLAQSQFDYLVDSNHWTVIPNILNLLASSLGVTSDDRVRLWLADKVKNDS